MRKCSSHKMKIRSSNNLSSDIHQELAAHGILLKDNMVTIGNSAPVTKTIAIKSYKKRAKELYSIIEKTWSDVSSVLEYRDCRKTDQSDGVILLFIPALQGLKRILPLYPALANYNKIKMHVDGALLSDTNTFSQNVMSKVIDYKLAIEWLSHLLAKNLYIKALLLACDNKNKIVEAKGVHGPYSNLDLPMLERVFNWSSIDEEVRGRENDKRRQSRYTMGFERYNESGVNEGFTWRELRNEPYLWGKEGENPYPHRNLLWGK